MLHESLEEIPGIGPVLIRKKKGLRHLSITIGSDLRIRLNIPWLIPKEAALLFLRSRQEWVRTALDKQRKKNAGAADAGHLLPAVTGKKEIEVFRRNAAGILIPRLEHAAAAHGFHYSKVTIKNNRSNWGSCSVKGNINLNMRLILLPEELQEFVILHELCHLRYPNHGPGFHTLLNSLCGGEEKRWISALRQWRLL